MSCELKVEKTDIKSAMENSVLSNTSKSEQEKTENSNLSRKKGRDQDLYFTLNERDIKQSAQTKSDPQS